MSEVVELIVSNSAEYHLRNPSLNLTGDERERVVRFCGTYECEHSVFWSGNPRVMVLPVGWNQQWYADIHRALGLAPAGGGVAGVRSRPSGGRPAERRRRPSWAARALGRPRQRYGC